MPSTVLWNLRLKSGRKQKGPDVLAHVRLYMLLLSGKDGIIFHLLAITPFQNDGNSYAQDIRVIELLDHSLNQFLSRLETNTLNESVTNRFVERFVITSNSHRSLL